MQRLLRAPAAARLLRTGPGAAANPPAPSIAPSPAVRARRQALGGGPHRPAQVGTAATGGGGGGSGGGPMEVEVKLRLGGKDDYERLRTALAPGVGPVYRQENFFFDGPGGELNARRVVVRVRLYNGDEKATLTVKGEQVLKDGIGRAPEVEEPLAPADARRFVADPPALLAHGSAIVRQLASQHGLPSLVGLGGFDNLRREFAWSPPGGRAFTLELDETAYPWGTLYELECETTEPEALRADLEALLASHGVSYSYSKTSKFANFVNRTLV
ncbi:triphosphate tunel metalloenzyme [Raphidocelis subcapitata]|uniref:Triphosphate tunel metalloenzyme n=1 Tax=Raphidocelis subcapitata TaxID=307507 RepID=A0A2V0P4S9_9CHLO|nr:triphosphate tunel metalloenzyme [Raphidocelis subcapitata]|eukprot:GBF92863.1 triphosphate tunel metalloenzyme [Raphidocelis subcapitata]